MAEKKAAEDAEERRLEAERKKEEEARLEREVRASVRELFPHYHAVASMASSLYHRAAAAPLMLIPHRRSAASAAAIFSRSQIVRSRSCARCAMPSRQRFPAP